MAEDELGIDLYLALHGTWLSRIPRLLAGENPDRLIRLLELAEPRAGISQAAMGKELHLSQSHMSKLKDRLVAANWVEVWRPVSNPRLLLMRSTPKAKASMAAIRSAMESLCAATSRLGFRQDGNVAKWIGS